MNSNYGHRKRSGIETVGAVKIGGTMGFHRNSACTALSAAVFSVFYFLLWSAIPASGQIERILAYDSRITVHENGNLTVQETIQVAAAGVEIRRGIYRTFPTRYKDRQGNRYVVGFKVLEVLRDGQTEPYFLKNESNGVAVYIGDKNVFLQPGVYTYTLSYQTDHILGFFKEYDELYWNVTGNGWSFPIEKVSADVRLPENIAGKVIKLDAWTGFQGSTEKAFTVRQDRPQGIQFETTRALQPREGLTILVFWPKGLIPEPRASEKIVYTLRNNVALGILILGTVLLFIYYLSIWLKVGKDPPKGPIVPIFNPPENLSPAALRYMRHMGYDHKVFGASILHMAVNGLVKIVEDKGSYTIRRIRQSDDGLPTEEVKIAKQLIPSADGSIDLKQSNHSTIQNAIQTLKNELYLKFHKNYFLTNKKYFIAGLLFSILVLVIGVATYANPVTVFLSLWLSLWSLGVAVLLTQVVRTWKNAILLRGNHMASVIGALVLTFFALPFVGGEVVGLIGLLGTTSPWIIACMLAIVLQNLLFYNLLKAPTLLGRRLLDKIDGFKMYLGTAEKDRLNFIAPTDKTPELFERFLPYALALDVEQAWAEQFSEVLARAGTDRGAYSPVWYSGRSWSPSSPATFATSFGASFASAIASSSTAPGSSSGSSGGSSGGGGGGGGGGGW